MKLVLYPPTHCQRCGSYSLHPPWSRFPHTWALSLFVHIFHCEDCGQRFGCVSASRSSWELRQMASLSIVVFLLLVLAATSWLAFGAINGGTLW